MATGGPALADAGSRRTLSQHPESAATRVYWGQDLVNAIALGLPSAVMSYMIYIIVNRV